MSNISQDPEVSLTVSMLPVKPPEKAYNAAKEHIDRYNVLIYRASYVTDRITGIKSPSVLLRCTACGGSYHESRLSSFAPIGFLDGDMKTVRSGDQCVCGLCGASARAIHVSAFREIYIVASIPFMTVCKVNGHTVLLSYYLQKNADKQGNVFYDLKKFDGIAVIGRRCIRLAGYYTNCYRTQISLRRFEARSCFYHCFYEWSPEEFPGFEPSVLVGTECENSAFDVFLRSVGENFMPAAFFKAYTKYPQLENLIRSGYSRLVNHILELCTNKNYYNDERSFNVSELSHYIDRKKKKPHEMLGVEKEDLARIKTLGEERFLWFAFIYRRYGIRMDEDQIDELPFRTISDMVSFLDRKGVRGSPFIHLINYLKKLKYSCSYYGDYLDMVERVYGSVPPELLFPKDLESAHDRVSNMIKEKENAEISEKIAAFARDMAWTCFEDPELGLMIRPCASHTELINEGKVLSHCVGTYADRVASRSTCILFIRRTSDPDKPYYTLEYKNGYINQDHGYKNKLQTPEILSFEKKWLAYIEKIKNRTEKEINNGKRSSRNQERIRAGA